MLEEERVVDPHVGDFVAFRQVGDHARGAHRCSACGYGIAVAGLLPRCPMCGGATWEESVWSPFGRAGDRP